MRKRSRHFRSGLFCLALAAGVCAGPAAWGQAQSSGAATGVARVQTPPVPVPGSPVEPFRRLLAADATERERLLALRQESQREPFRAALREYDRLSPGERERRLQALELRFQITHLLRLPPEARTQAFARLPAGYQPVVRVRLDYWNQFPSDVQKTFLTNERLMKIITVVPAGPPLPRLPTSSNQLGRLNEAVLNWNDLPETKRRLAENRFKQMFEAGSSGGITSSPVDRETMQRVLERFNHLTPVRRSSCVTNFSRFAAMSLEERRAFLQSAEEWQRMNAEDRQAWRDLVKHTPPPPGYRQLPPLPVIGSRSGTSEVNSVIQ
jgi:hypothetical protein